MNVPQPDTSDIDLQHALVEMMDAWRQMEEAARGFRHYLIENGWPDPVAQGVAGELLNTLVQKTLQ